MPTAQERNSALSWGDSASFAVCIGLFRVCEQPVAAERFGRHIRAGKELIVAVETAINDGDPVSYTHLTLPTT